MKAMYTLQQTNQVTLEKTLIELTQQIEFLISKYEVTTEKAKTN